MATDLTGARRPGLGRAMWLVSLLVGAGLVSGCGDTRKSLGLDRTAPDEFAVVSRAPLSLPPSYTLEPPRPGAPRPQERSARTQGSATFFGTGGGASGRDRTTTGSGGQVALLTAAGADRAMPDIRAVVDRETQDLIVADRSFIDRLIFWRKQTSPYTIVDPTKEAERLRTTAAGGQPVTEGETPVIVRRKKAPLEGLF